MHKMWGVGLDFGTLPSSLRHMQGGKIMLTNRERYLMFQAFNARINYSIFSIWLNDMAADAVTIEMVLEKDAPATDHEAAIKRAVAAERGAIAKWYAEEGWLLDEDDVAYAIRRRGEK